jgi:hypothetical protein
MANCPVRPALITSFRAKSILQKPGESFREFYIHHNTIVTVSETSDLACVSTDFGETWTESQRLSSTITPFATYGNGEFVFFNYNGSEIQFSSDGLTWDSLIKTGATNVTAISPTLYCYYGLTKFILTKYSSASPIWYLSGDKSGEWTYGSDPQSGGVNYDAIYENSRFIYTHNNTGNAYHYGTGTNFTDIISSGNINYLSSPGYSMFVGESKACRDVCKVSLTNNKFHRFSFAVTPSTFSVTPVSSYDLTDTPRSWGRFTEGFGRYKDRVILGFSQDGSVGVVTSNFGENWTEFYPDEAIQQAYMVNAEPTLTSYACRGYQLRYHEPSNRWFLGAGSAGLFELTPVYVGE